MTDNTIFALSSGHGRAGVAVIRVTGSLAGEAVEAIAGGLPAPRMASLRVLRHPKTNEELDKALVLWFPGPASFTGEDSAEFQVHGGMAVVQGVIDALSSIEGLRLAEPGEFSRRAFENGKLDLTEVEGLADLIDAETQAQRKQALRQSGGALGELYEGWRMDVLLALASVEAALDFSDEADVPEEIAAEARPYVDKAYGEICSHLNDGRRGEILRDGFRVVIAGPPNAGKSSLLNLLAQRDVAIVSDEAGTTRDVIEVRLNLGGYPVLLTDTAGIRETNSSVEREGIRRSRASVAEADLILWMLDASSSNQEALSSNLEDPPHDGSYPPSSENDLPPPNETPFWSVFNKTDLASDGISSGDTCGQTVGKVYKISVKTGDGIDDLINSLTEQVSKRVGIDEAPVISRARHRQELEACREALEQFSNGDPSELELRAEDLRLAAQAIGRITGRIDVEDVLDEIFSSFCIGK